MNPKKTLYTVTFKNGAVHNINAYGAVEAVILAWAACINRGDEFRSPIASVKNNDNGYLYGVEDIQLRTIERTGE